MARDDPKPGLIDPQLLLGAYFVGVFPMADARTAEDVYWVEPRHRAILPLGGFRLSTSLRKTIGADRYRVTLDKDFAGIIALCAESVENRPDTWINPPIEQSFLALHAMGHAHSIEVWDGEQLVGGLYGLVLGRAFFGESMVSRARDASKVALAWLVARMRRGGFTLLDCQFMTPHLASLGAVEITRDDYQLLLAAAVSGVGGAAAPPDADGAAGDLWALERGGAVPLPAGTAPTLTEFGPPTGKVIVQALVQTS